MKNRLILALLFLSAALSSRAQYFEAGGTIGLSNYMGDLSNNSRTVFMGESSLAAGVFGRYNFSDLFALRLQLTYASISGEDANARTEEIRQRNLSFRSILGEGALIGEINLPGFQPYNLSRPISPYFFLGVGLTYFNPQAELGGEWYALQPLGTEGQGLPGNEGLYSRFTPVIPFGAGVKFAPVDQMTLGLELGARKSFTDYLDDVSGDYASQEALLTTRGPIAAALSNRTNPPVDFPEGAPRGDDAISDWYFYLGLTVSWNFLDNGLVGSRGRNTRKAGCQRF